MDPSSHSFLSVFSHEKGCQVEATKIGSFYLHPPTLSSFGSPGFTRMLKTLRRPFATEITLALTHPKIALMERSLVQHTSPRVSSDEAKSWMWDMDVWEEEGNGVRTMCNDQHLGWKGPAALKHLPLREGNFNAGLTVHEQTKGHNPAHNYFSFPSEDIFLLSFQLPQCNTIHLY